MAPNVNYMKTHTLAALLAILTGCAGTPSIDDYAIDTLKDTTRQAVVIQQETRSTWDEAAATAIRQLPGGGRELSIEDGVITYQTDEVCYGAWLVNLTEFRVRPCLEIDWGTDRLWPGGRSDCFVTEEGRP